jgi:hypothetical protein
VPFEILNRALMLFRLFKSCKRAQVAAFAGIRILFSRVEPKLSGFEFTNHLRVDALRIKPVASAV